MIYDTPGKVSELYLKCKTTYFSDYRLKIPSFGVSNSSGFIARVSANYKKGKIVGGKPTFFFSDQYDLTDKAAIDIMCHEIIHYLFAKLGYDDWNKHGERFINFANEMNKKYNLNISVIYDVAPIPCPPSQVSILLQRIINWLFNWH